MTISPSPSATSPVRAMRGLAWGSPLALLGLLALIAAGQAAIFGTAFSLRFEGGMTTALAPLGFVFVAAAASCRDEAEYRAARNWYLVALLALLAVPVGLALLGRGTWGAVAGFASAALAIGLLAILVGRGRWLAREQK